MSDVVRGSCLCGGVRYEIDGGVHVMGNCHCSICRRYSGAAYGVGVRVARSSVRWPAGEDLIRVYRHEDRKDIGFCSRCGSSLFTANDWDAPTEASGINIRAGTLDDDPGVRPLFHIYVGSKAPWHEITDDLPQYEEMFG